MLSECDDFADSNKMLSFNKSKSDAPQAPRLELLALQQKGQYIFETDSAYNFSSTMR